MKFLQMVCGLISIITWIYTQEDALNRIAGRAAPRAAQVAQVAAPNAVDANAGSERAVAAQAPSVSGAAKEAAEKKIATDFPYMAGEYEALTNTGEKYKYWIQVETTYLPKGSLEGDGIQANVLVTVEKAERATAFFKAAVDVYSPTQFVLVLDHREIGQFLNSPSVSYDNVDYTPERILVNVADAQTWDLTPGPNTEHQAFKFKGRAMKMATQSLDRFAGKWKGKIGENPFQLELKSNGKYLTGMYRAVMAYPCRYDEVSVRLTGENRFSLIGGKQHATESYSGCMWPAMRGQLMADGKLKVLDYGRAEENTEGTLTR